MRLKKIEWVIVIATVSLLCGISYGEKENGRPELCETFKAIVKALFPAASVENVKAEVEGIKVVEIELKNDGKECSIDVAEDGTVMSVETQVAPKSLPPAVAKAIKEKAGDAKITTIEREEIRAEIKLVVLKKPQTVYETKFIRDGKEYELKVAASGAVLGMKVVNEEEEKDAMEEDGDDGEDDDEQECDDDDEDGDDDEEGDDDDEEDDDEGDDKDEDGEVTVSLNDVPKPVKKTILNEAKGGKVKEIEREKEDGKVVYDADIVIEGKKFELKVAENGKLLSKEAEEDEGKDADADDDEEEGDDEDEDGDDDDEEDDDADDDEEGDDEGDDKDNDKDEK